jgi:hypothetical protein
MPGGASGTVRKPEAPPGCPFYGNPYQPKGGKSASLHPRRRRPAPLPAKKESLKNLIEQGLHGEVNWTVPELLMEGR